MQDKERSETEQLSQTLGETLFSQRLVMTTAESCTGGGVASAMTDIAGSSAWFDRAFVTYSNEAKQEMLGVKLQTLIDHGAVSEATVIEMVRGAIAHSNAQVGVAISGIAGPSGGTTEKPVGTVCFAWADEKGWLKVDTYCFAGDRTQVRQQAIVIAQQVLLTHLEEASR